MFDRLFCLDSSWYIKPYISGYLSRRLLGTSKICLHSNYCADMSTLPSAVFLKNSLTWRTLCPRSRGLVSDISLHLSDIGGLWCQCSKLRFKFVHPPGAEGAKCVHQEFNSNAHKLKYTLNIRQCGTHAGCTAFKIVHPASKSCTLGAVQGAPLIPNTGCLFYIITDRHYVWRFATNRRTWALKRRTCPDVRRFATNTATEWTHVHTVPTEQTHVHIVPTKWTYVHEVGVTNEQ